MAASQASFCIVPYIVSMIVGSPRVLYVLRPRRISLRSVAIPLCRRLALSCRVYIPRRHYEVQWLAGLPPS
jgi:hypothetical protein